MVMCYETDTKTDKELHSQWGLVFKQVGYIYPNVENHFVTIDLEIPKRRDMDWKFDMTLRCGITKSSLVTEMCQKAAETVRMVKRGSLQKVEQIDSKFQDLRKLLPIAKRQREKRFVFPLIALFAGAVGFVSQVHMYRKVNALQQSVSVLEKNDFILSKRIVSLYENQVTIVQKAAEKFKALENKIENQNLYIRNVTHTLSLTIMQVQDTFLAIQSYSYKLALAVDQFTYKTYLYFQSADRLLEAYYNGILDLMTGKIPRDLISPTELTEILEETAVSLQIHLPDYELLHQNLAHYYKKTDLIYDIVQGHLVVTIPIMIKKKNKKLMPLYQVQTCHVPYVIQEESETAEGSYTKLKLDHEYIAILETNFVEFTSVQMDNCVSHDEIWTCDSLLLQTHHSKVSCLAAIYWEHDSEAIKQLCNFEYFHNISPRPVVLESENNILMANLDVPWSFDCQNRNVPMRVKGSRYAILTRSSICGCSILGTGFYIEEKVCKQTLDKIVLRYPLNAAVMSYYSDVMKQNHLTNMSGLFPHPPKVIIPKLNLSINDDDNVLVKTNVGTPISLARVSGMLQQQKQIFYDADEKQISNSKFENWWSGENIAIGCAFVLAIIGGIAAIIAICNCVRTHRVSSTVGALMLHQIPKANAIPMFCKRDASITEILPPLLVQLLISISLVLIAKLLWKWYSQWSIVKIIDPRVVSLKTKNRVHMSMEIFNQMEYLRVYLLSIQINPMYVTMHGSIVKLTLKLELRKLYCYLELGWDRSDMSIKQDGRTVHLPRIAYIPIYRYLLIKRLMNSTHGVRFIMTTDGMTYVQSERLITKLEVETI